MPSFEYISRAENARVLLVSQRRRLSVVSRCLDYEFEDLVAQVDAVDLIAPIRAGPRLGGPLHRAARGLERVGAGPLATLVSGGAPPLDRKYPLVFFTCLNLSDLMQHWPLRPWLRAAERSACYVDEVWAHEIPGRAGETSLLRQFDVLFVGYQGSVDAVAKATGRPTFYLPHSVNTQTFCPYPAQPQRLIDIYAMGRCPRRTHEVLLREASERGWFYMYDTTGSAPVADPVMHRRRLADTIHRTRYFLVNAAWADHREATGGQQELGYRFFEGTAGGAVLIGDPPKTRAFQELFPWEDAVVCFPKDSPDIGLVLDELEGQPDRVARIRARNVRNSLLRHDGMYRWAEVLQTVGLPPLKALELRRQALAERARQFPELIDPRLILARVESSATNPAAAASIDPPRL